MTRKDLRRRIKLSFGLNPDREDGNLTDDDFNLAINIAIRQVAYDCNLVPELRKIALEVEQWRYPMDADVDIIRSCWYLDGSRRIPLTYCSPEEFYNFYDTSNKSDVPMYYTYPMMQGEIYEFWAGAPDVYDYILSSHVTSGSVRTVIDSGINFGFTRQGKHVKPGDVVHNLTDDSYGYVEVLDITTPLVTGTAGVNTTTHVLSDTGVDFESAGIVVGNIICTPGSGVVKGYGFVTKVEQNKLTYTDYYSVDGSVSFKQGDTYKVGHASEIRLSGKPPHPGLRSGGRNYFHVGDVLATITGTVFSSQRVTGVISGSISVGNVAIADGGGHGEVTGIGDDYVEVTFWVGGMPTDGENVVIRECDEYHVETVERIQRAIWLAPAPSASDTVGTESLEILYTSLPRLPVSDDEQLEIPDKYEQPLLRCCEWQSAILTGTFSRMELNGFEVAYKSSVMQFRGDIYRPPSGHQLTVWGNRYNVNRRGYTWRPKSG